jgi:hypothetical protein
VFGCLYLKVQKSRRKLILGAYKHDNLISSVDTPGYLASTNTPHSTNNHHNYKSTMKISFAAMAAFAIPALSQSPVVTPPWATSDLAAWSSKYDSLVSDGKIPSTLTTAPWPTGSWGPGSGPWGSGSGPWGSGQNGNGKGGPGGQDGHGGSGHWGGTLHLSPTYRQTNNHTNAHTGSEGPGPWGSSSWGPWSDWSTKSDWRSAPWTAWWGGSACPASDWPGWTAGPWSTSAPWTTWSACTASTTATSVGTVLVSGTASPTTAYGLKVAQASETAAGSTPTQASTTGGAEMMTASLGLAVGAAVLGLAVGL